MPPHLLLTISLGLVLAAAVAALAYRAHALSRSGAFAAWAVGTVVFGVGGWRAAAALLTFSATSSLLSQWRRRQKETFGYEKGGRRDAGQVLANGGVASACLLLMLLGIPSAHLLFLAALAAANADTWATEIGAALDGQTYDLRTGRQADAGTSGAVSLAGTLAALAGAALMGLFAGSPKTFAVVTLAGFGGALCDSLLGATVQAQWRDPITSSLWTEQPQPGPPGRGVRGVGNDAVNTLCTLSAAGLAALLAQCL